MAKIMLALCMAFAIGITGIRAQTRRPIPYHFAPVPHASLLTYGGTTATSSPYSSPLLKPNGVTPGWPPRCPNHAFKNEWFGVREEIMRGDGFPPAAENTDTASECDHMSNFMEFTADPQAEYDTAKAFTVLCANNGTSAATNGIAGFEYASDGNDHRNNDPARFAEFREWLKSVLYLRTDTLWYCWDVGDIIHTFDYYPGHGVYVPGAEAIVRYIVGHQRCDSAMDAYFESGLQYPKALYDTWRDTVKDSLTEPKPDTTVPSIDSIGLSILRGPQYAGIKETLPPEGTQEISGLSATENPLTNTTAIKFNLADYGLVTFQLYDLLGSPVTTNGIGQVLYPGAHEFDIDGTKLAAGTYIARVVFHDGDVESIMVVRK